MFIYGGVGLGKTHLMHAVGNRLLANRPDARFSTSTPNSLSPDVVKGLPAQDLRRIQGHYHSLDLLLIDDIQFFANKDRTQEEFFNAFRGLAGQEVATS